jgi:hypothetical protein
MRYILITFLFICVCIQFQELQAATFTSRNNGNWADPCTWSNSPTCNTSTAVAGVNIPGPMDDVIISGHHIVTITSNVSVNSVYLDKGNGGNKTTLNVFGDIDLIIANDFRMDSQAVMYVDGGAFINVKGNVCVKNDGNIVAQGTGPVLGGLFVIDGCATIGSTDCVPGGSGTPSFINPTYLNYCIACAPNSGNFFDGGACFTMMPVHLVYFKATYQNADTQVALSWVTLSEKDNSSFTIERSEDGINFADLLTVPGSINSSTVVPYQAIDNYPIPGTSYYRLRQTDTDGTTSHSKIVSVHSTENTYLIISPNPFDGKKLDIYSLSAGEKLISITDFLGKTLSSNRYTLSSNGTHTTIMFNKPLVSGIYFIRVAAGNTVITRKVIVH